MDFLSEQGVLALGSRLKALSDRCYGIADLLYREQGFGLQARWFPMLRLLHARGPLTVTEVADTLGQTHSAVSQLATKLVAGGWLHAAGDAGDRRRRRLALSARAEAEMQATQPLWRELEAELEQRLAAGGLMRALAALEEDLAANPVVPAVLARCRARQVRALRVVPFEPRLRGHFYRLNAEWLSRYFRIEPIDHAVLSDPEGRVLAPGGAIFFALLDDEVVGTCALLQESPGVYELTKMAVTGRHQGLGIGRALLEAAIAEFERRGGRELFLESHSSLRPALRLYESAGFEMQPGIRPGSHYERADVYMVYRGANRGKDEAEAAAITAAEGPRTGSAADTAARAVRRRPGA